MEYQLSPVVRLDTFRNVPEDRRDELIARISMTHSVLRRQAGFMRDQLLESRAPDGTTTVVTIAEWASADAIPAAAAAVRELHARERFDPHEFLQRLGIDAEFGRFRPLEEVLQ